MRSGTFGTFTTEEKVYQQKNVPVPYVFFLSSVLSAIFHQIFFILQQCLDPNPNFFAGQFGQNLRILSDSFQSLIF
jgi:hypothetical protein